MSPGPIPTKKCGRTLPIPTLYFLGFVANRTGQNRHTNAERTRERASDRAIENERNNFDRKQINESKKTFIYNLNLSLRLFQMF